MIKVNMIKSLLILPLILCSVNSYALTCYEKSAAFEKEGEKYYDLEKEYPVLTDKQKKEIKEFFAAFERESLKGSGTSTICTGSDKSPKKKVKQEELKGSVSVLSDGEFVIKLDIYKKKSKSQRDATLKFFGKKSLQKIKALTSSDMHVAMKVRNVRYRQASWIHEELVDFNVNGKTLTITSTYYTSGYLIGQTIRKLHYK